MLSGVVESQPNQYISLAKCKNILIQNLTILYLRTKEMEAKLMKIRFDDICNICICKKDTLCTNVNAEPGQIDIH